MQAELRDSVGCAEPIFYREITYEELYMLKQKELKEILRYNPDTGDFIWLCDMGTNKVKGLVAGWETASGYIGIMIDSKQHQAHRLAWLYVHGCFPEFDIDHINGNRSDNRIANIRAVNRLENMRNQKLRTTNKSGHSGVRFCRGSWHANISVNYKRIHLGCFATKDEAILVRKNAETEHGFHPNHGRTA